MQLILTKLQQLPPFLPHVAQVKIAFSIAGDLPDFVQIYALTAAGSEPAVVAATLPMTAPQAAYESQLSLQAGTYYTIQACPRRGDAQSPDDMMDGEYWESFCALGSLITQTSPPPLPHKRSPPQITGLQFVPASVREGGRVTVSFSSSTPYGKVLIGWTEQGEANRQGEVELNPAATSGSWSAPTVPGRSYTFSANGGEYSGIGGYTYSGWGPGVQVVAPPNLRSLRQYLVHSSVDPTGEHFSSLLPPRGSLRQFMKL